MKCKLCEDKLLEYLYGELGEEDAAAMDRHLEASDACRQACEGYASVLETVAEEGEEGPSPALHTRIMGHAEEARPGRRSLWAWMFRPAVTTAVIGAVAAGVYFTTLRHKPPSYLDERILSEESLLGKSLVEKSKQRSTPPSSIAKVGSPKKEAMDEAFLARLAEPPATIEQEEAAPELSEALEKSAPVLLARPPEAKSPFMAAGSMDEELARAPARMKAGAPPAEGGRAVVGGEERAPGPAYMHRGRATGRGLHKGASQGKGIRRRLAGSSPLPREKGGHQGCKGDGGKSSRNSRLRIRGPHLPRHPPPLRGC